MEHHNTTQDSIQNSGQNPETYQHSTPPVKPAKKENFFAEIVRFTLIALVIVVPVRLFIAQPFIVSGASMEPTFSSGEYLIVDQITYRLEEPERGDIIVFRFPRDPSKFFIKRIIAIPGDTIEIEQDKITIKNADNLEGIVLDEPYVVAMEPSATLTEVLGEHEYFVMGDNRNASSDSRIWGVLRDNLIVGRAILRLLPITEVDILPGKFESNVPTPFKLNLEDLNIEEQK